MKFYQDKPLTFIGPEDVFVVTYEDLFRYKVEGRLD